MSKTTFSNWLGNVVSEVTEILRPTSVQQLQDMVGKETGRLLVFGSKMSKTPILGARAGKAIDTSGLDQILELGADYVVAQAGITLYELSRALYAQGRQLPGFTITVNPSIGGCITAPTKGVNQPFRPGANSVSSAIDWVTLVKPSGERVQLHARADEAELALLKDSYGTIGVVAEARLQTVPLVSAEVQEEIVPLQPFLHDASALARGIENRVLLLPKLGCGMVRNHRDVRVEAPSRPYEQVIGDPTHPYVSLATRLPRWARKAILKPAVRIGVDRKPQRKLHIENLTLYPAKEKFFLDFIQWSVPTRDLASLLPEIIDFCSAHPDFPPESLVELIRINPESRFFDSDDRVAVDPVCFDRHAGARWERFYRDYNGFMVQRRASPYLNQTRFLDPGDLRHIYGDRYEAWRGAIFAADPERKFGSTYLDHVLDLQSLPAARTQPATAQG